MKALAKTFDPGLGHLLPPVARPEPFEEGIAHAPFRLEEVAMSFLR